jgi:hypothetical protein
MTDLSISENLKEYFSSYLGVIFTKTFRKGIYEGIVWCVDYDEDESKKKSKWDKKRIILQVFYSDGDAEDLNIEQFTNDCNIKEHLG